MREYGWEESAGGEKPHRTRPSLRRVIFFRFERRVRRERSSGDMIKEHGMLLSVFLLFKFVSKDLIISALTAYTIHGLAVLFSTLPSSIRLFLTKECNYMEVVSLTPLIHNFIKPQVAASIPGLFFCVWYAAMKYCVANNVLGNYSRIQGKNMLSLRSHKTGAILLLLLADAVCPSLILAIGDCVIPGTFVALALRFAVTRVSKNRFFNCAFLLCIVSSTVIIIILNWFQAAQNGEPNILHVAPGVICFLAVYCFWNGEVKLDGMNQLMGIVWDWKNIYGNKLKFNGSVLAANEDGGRCEDDAAALREDHGDDPKDGSSGLESSEDDYGYDWQDGDRVVQFLAISANFPICAINCYDYAHGLCIYEHSEGEIQGDGMSDLVPTGPPEILKAYGLIGLEVYYTTPGIEGDVGNNEGGRQPLGPRTRVQWNVSEGDEVEEYTRVICAGLGRKLEITYLVIPSAVQTNVEVRLKLNDPGSRRRAVYGKIKANAIHYGNKSIHIFNCDRGRCLSFSSGTTSILPLSPSKFALPCSRLLKFHMEVDLTVITTCDSHEEEKNLKFSLKFTREITSQEGEEDGDVVEVKIKYYSFFLVLDGWWH